MIAFEALTKHIPNAIMERPTGKKDIIEGGIININGSEIDLNALAQKYECPSIAKTKSDMLLHIREETGIELERAKWIVYDYFNFSMPMTGEKTTSLFK